MLRFFPNLLSKSTPEPSKTIPRADSNEPESALVQKRCFGIGLIGGFCCSAFGC